MFFQLTRSKDASGDFTLPRIASIDDYIIGQRADYEGTSFQGDPQTSRLFRFRFDCLVFYDELISRLGKLHPCRTLCVGVGHGEEPLSLLAVAHYIAQGAGLSVDQVVDLELVELVSYRATKIEDALEWAPHLGSHNTAEPVQARSVRDIFTRPIPSEAREALSRVVGDPNRARFGTPVEAFVHIQEPQSYDVVFVNNVLQHLGSRSALEGSPYQYLSPYKVGHEGWHEFMESEAFVPQDYSNFFGCCERILDLVVPGGLCFMHVGDQAEDLAALVLKHSPFFSDNFQPIKIRGLDAISVFRRKSLCSD